MGDRFKMTKDGSLEEFDELYYDSEEELRNLIAEYPNLINYSQKLKNSEDRFKLLLVDKEVGIPQYYEGSIRWKIDLLFLTDDAIPVFVEVKQSSDSRIYREVIGQMIDYLAHGSKYWEVDYIKNLLKNQLESNGLNYGFEIKKFLGKSIPEKQFWKDVHGNLRTGNAKLVCVSDELPIELKTSLEFLEQYLDGIEVYGVQLAKFENNTFDREFTRLDHELSKPKL